MHYARFLFLVFMVLCVGCAPKEPEGPAEIIGRSFDQISKTLNDDSVEGVARREREVARREADLDRRERDIEWREREFDRRYESSRSTY